MGKVPNLNKQRKKITGFLTSFAGAVGLCGTGVFSFPGGLIRGRGLGGRLKVDTFMFNKKKKVKLARQSEYVLEQFVSNIIQKKMYWH